MAVDSSLARQQLVALPVGLAHRLRSTQLALCALLVVLTLVPLAYLLVNSFNIAPPTEATFVFGLGNWMTAYADPDTVGSIWTTVWLAVARTAIALPVAMLLAWLIARTNMPGASILEFGMWVAYSLPVLALTMGWILLLDPRAGLVNVALSSTGVTLNIYSYVGIIWIHLVSRTIPIQVILLIPAFRRVGARLEEASQVCGASKLRTLIRITAPVLAPAAVPLAILSIVQALQSLDVELVVGIPAHIYVYGTRIYQVLTSNYAPLYGVATALGAGILVVLLTMAVLSNRFLRGQDYTTVKGDFSTARIDLGPTRWLWCVACFVFVGLGVGLPMAATVVGSAMRRFGFFNIRDPFTLQHWSDVFGDPNFGLALSNTLLLGLGVAVLGMLLFTSVAHGIVRGGGPVGGLLDGLAWIPRGVPGVLLSLALLWLFLSTPLRSVLYGTLVGMTLAITISSLPTGVQLAKAALAQIGPEMEEASRMCGASGARTARRVLGPAGGWGPCPG